ncbi:primase-helicase family protein [Flavobacterium filum]|uniref:primase-helicase family protein n=1 Tax=Flavobacterium filum TaxID=370974 RepID=UPI0004112005|nr:primase-helicase family protein [Flavobacterium filum]
MKELNNYMRVGTEFYKKTETPEGKTILQKWNRQTLIDDYGKESIAKVKKYDSFCIIPSHNQFEQVVNNCYNQYQPLSYELKEGNNYQNIIQFLKHIFGEQFELGLDYLTILWQKPTQILPILCLVSTERNTGKTTFINLLKLIFESNMTINTNDDFRSRFNADWSGKLIIGVDEVLLDKKEDSERIKNLSTAQSNKIEPKGRDKFEQSFFGKFILYSNNEDSFIKIDNEEIRYWIRKINPLENRDVINLLQKMKVEVPYFANFLNSRNISTIPSSRMWFNSEELYTQALGNLINGNRSYVEKELYELLIDEFENSGQDELYYTAKNLLDMLKRNNVIAQSNYIIKLLKEKYKLKPTNSSYKYYRTEILNPNDKTGANYTIEKGRFYTFKKENFISGVEVLKTA